MRSLTAGLSLVLVLTTGPAGPSETVSVAASSTQRKAPERPRASFDTALPKLEGRMVRVAAGGDLQQALDAARPGDVITLEPRATYRGPFRLRRKSGTGWIVVSAAPSTPALPAPGRRVDPSNAGAMPKLVASEGSVIEADPGAHHYRLIGLEIAPADGTFLHALVKLGDNDTDPNALPDSIVIDRCYLHGDPAKGARRGVAMNARRAAVVDSYLSDFKEVGADSQAIAGWNGTGPFKIDNNYLEAAGENVMFGGADPTIRGLVPADIEIRHNHLAKPLRWKIGHASFEGVEWAVKNLFELKNARRVLVEGNLLEYNWPHGQNGFAILFTVRNQDGGAPWSAVEDVTFANNVIRHVAAGVNMLGRDDNYPSQVVKRVEIRNNLFLDVGGAWGAGRLFQLLDGTTDVVIDHNTALQTGDVLFGGDGEAHTGFVFANNIVQQRGRGITGSGTNGGLPALTRYFPAAVVRRNVIVGGTAADYPGDNFFPRALEEVGFAAHHDGIFRLAGSSPFARAGTDGRDPGANLDASDLLDHGLSRVILPAYTALSGMRRASRGALADEAAFWMALGLLGYVYFGYPVVAWLRARVWTRAVHRAPGEPTVTVVMAAHNEAHHLAERIDNLLALDYPSNRLEILIGSDGSTDGTPEIARGYAQRGVRVVSFRERHGKASVLNSLVPVAKGDIVVFADARQQFDREALRALVADLADPEVGAASGELMLQSRGSAATAGQGSAFYWRYEKFIRSVESRADSTIGATGAIYAIRRELFEPIPDDTILDDVLIPLRIVHQGYRVVFNSQARAYDRTSSTAGEEFARKARTIAGTFQLFARERWLLNPFRNRLWFETVSHKALRLMLPVLHAAIFVANLALVNVWPYDWLFAAQTAFYAAALAGCTGRARRSIAVCVPYAICLLAWATLVGFMRFVTDRQPVTWERWAPQPEQARPIRS
jgi:cellulose synthase/poly-beta-1,6-N-acetylglucosamine synthase-like glycosyltransferase